MNRLETANTVLRLFAPDTWITQGRGVWVHWKRSNGYQPSEMRRKWMVRRGNDFYPVWHRYWGHGGTCTTALSQLVRFIQERPVLPISTWRMWTGENVRLGRDNGPQIVQTLLDGEYPEHVPCVLCGETIVGHLDWWSLDKVSGPCCGWTSGCRQKGKVAA